MIDASFDAYASKYDDIAMSQLGVVLRGRVRGHLARFVHRGSRVLDLGCGTGLDMAWAHERGALVQGVESSEAMAEIARTRLGGKGSIVVADIDSDAWVDELDGQFDVILANFGVVNCVSDLDSLGRRLDRLLADGGRVVLVPMARCVPWEQIPAALRLDRRTLLRRARRRPFAVEGYGELQIRYLTARTLKRSLGGSWKTLHCEALGWALPTFERRSLFERHPRSARVLRVVDSFGARGAAFLGAGDHQIVIMGRQ